MLTIPPEYHISTLEIRSVVAYSAKLSVAKNAFKSSHFLFYSQVMRINFAYQSSV